MGRPPFKAAVAFHLAGDAKAAEAAMAQALDEANPHMFPKYQRIATALGITARGSSTDLSSVNGIVGL
jgi:hypothetical protein